MLSTSYSKHYNVLIIIMDEKTMAVKETISLVVYIACKSIK